MSDIAVKYFTPHQEYFIISDPRHGSQHTARVMLLSLLLGSYLGEVQAAKEAFCSAFIHDMARRHDGYCTLHGKWAVEEKLPQFRKLFQRFCGTEKSLFNIADATINHCQEADIEKDKSSCAAAMILKDADALDRIRFGENKISIKYLRYYQSKQMIEFARYFYYATCATRVIELPVLFSFASLVPDTTAAVKVKEIWNELHLDVY